MLAPCVNVLQTPNSLVRTKPDCAAYRLTTRQRRRISHLVLQGSLTNLSRVSNSATPFGRVDDQLDLPVLDCIHNVGAPFVYLVDLGNRQARSLQRLRRAAGRHQLKPNIDQITRQLLCTRLIRLTYADECHATTREFFARRRGGLGKSFVEAGTN